MPTVAMVYRYLVSIDTLVVSEVFFLDDKSKQHSTTSSYTFPMLCFNAQSIYFSVLRNIIV